MDNVLVGGSAHDDFIHKINPNKTIETIYPSVHPIDRQQRKDDYVLMVTAWKPGKYPEYIFEIIKQLPNIKVKMAGKWLDPLYRQEFEKLVAASGFIKQIEIIGEVNEAELAKLYARATVLLQTNDDKGFGMPAMEAAGSGTTFIIPRGQGVCDLFVNGKDGFYTKEKDTIAIVSLLSRLMGDKKLAVSMGNQALEKVQKRYSWQKHAKALESLIDRTLRT